METIISVFYLQFMWDSVVMSLLKYFRPINGKHSNDETLPSPAGTLSTLMPSTAISAANSSVKNEMKRSARSPYSLAWPDRFFPFLFVVAEKRVWSGLHTHLVLVPPTTVLIEET